MRALISAWWLAAEAFGFLILCMYLNHVAYRTGIWDGAFNHFLPIVRKEMVYYDSRRAAAIFDAEGLDADGFPRWRGKCGICHEEPCGGHGHDAVPEGEV